MATTDDMKSIAETIRKAQYGKDVREAIARGFEQLEHEINSLKPPFLTADDLSKSEYITDTNVATDYTADVPTSVDIDDTNGDDEIQGLTIQEGGK